MAFELQLLLFGPDASQPSLKLEPNWWPVREILRQFPFEQQNQAGEFVRLYELSLDQLVDLHLDYLPRLREGIYSYPSWQRIIGPKIQLLQEIIEKKHAFSRLYLQIREWDSGY